MQELLHNQVVLYSGIGLVLLVILSIYNKGKLIKFGLFLSTKLNALIGKKNEEKVEEVLQDILDGMKSDNEAKK